MLSTIRNFSKTIYAKVLLGIVVIPFVFWGMGSSFKGGSKNVIVKIDDDSMLVMMIKADVFHGIMIDP